MAPTYQQANRPMTVTTPLGPDVLLLVGFSGHEAISQLFSFELDLAAEDQTKVVFDKVLGRKVTINLTVPGGQKRYFNGICTSLAQGMRGIDHTTYQMEVSPHLWLLTLRSRSRIFQNETVPEVLKSVLDFPDVVYDLEGTFHPRTYCVQHRETDFNFASRLMEEEGIYYYFKHKADSHQLVVSNKAAFPELQPADLILQQAEGTHVEEERITRWRTQQQLRSLKVTLRDYHFQMPRQSLEANQEIQDDVKVGKVTHKLKIGDADSLEIYDWPGEYSHRFDAVDRGGADRPDEMKKLLEDNERTAKIRMEQEAVQAISIQGSSQYRHLVSGHTFTLKEQVVVPYDGSSSHDGKYVLTSINHTGRMSGAYRSGDAQEVLYDNSFTCIPAALPFRPQRITPKPVVVGTQTAVVVGAKGEQIHIDKYGRVKVQFHWDREGKHDADSSCWIRVSQIWAGKGWGAFFWPRVGHEVVVGFEEGDPDRPLISGSVYNSDNMPPFSLPLNDLVGGFKSCTERGESHDKFNGLIFYDKPGNEHVHIHSQNHQVSTNESSSRVHVGQTYAHVVGGIPGLSSGSGGSNGASGTTAEGDQVDDGQITKLGDPPPTSDRQTSYGDQAPAEWGLPGDLARQVNLAFGEVFESTVGLKYEQRVGGKTEFYFNPLAWLANVGDSGPSPVMMGLFASVLNKTEVKLCAETSLLYGTGMEIHYGGKVEYAAKKLDYSSSTFELANVVMAAQMLGTLLAGGVASSSDVWSGFWWFLFNLPWQVGLALLVGLETKTYVAKHAAKEASDAADALLQMANVDLNSGYLAGTDQGKQLEALIKQKTERAQTLLADILQLTTKGESKDSFKKGDYSHQIEGHYGIRAERFTVDATAGADLPPFAQSISLNAVGDGTTGILVMSATNDASMTTGLNYMGHKNDSTWEDGWHGDTSYVECSPGGQVYLRNPPDLLTNPLSKVATIRMRPPGEIRLRVGDETKDVMPGPTSGYSQIMMTDKTIELLCNKGGIAAGIRISPFGVRLYNSVCEIDVGDPSSTGSPGEPPPNPQALTQIKINGAFFDLTADVKAGIKTLVLSKTGQGVINHQAGITNAQ